MRVTALRKSSLASLAIGIFAVTGIVATAPTASAVANPIDEFVDCSDSFWAIACENDPVWGTSDLVPLDNRIPIDDDVTCTESGEFIICHT